ncbi:MAG: hypothetical protein L0206_17855, partial [Actinobacteria bacterium]|nr:hypothetical protein [Actinomycetota bacterium]
MKIATKPRWLLIGALLGGALVASCSGGGGGGSGGSVQAMELGSISVSDGAVWEINRPIRFEFSQEIDFSTV